MTVDPSHIENVIRAARLAGWSDDRTADEILRPIVVVLSKAINPEALARALQRASNAGSARR